MNILIGLVIGCFIGWIITFTIFILCIKGTLFCISDDEQPYAFVVLDKTLTLDNLASHKFVIFRTSQKKQSL